MVKSKRFEPIANLARDSEREAAKVLGSALKNLEDQVEQLDTLIRYQADYNQRLNSSASANAGMNAQKLNEYIEFLSKLSTAIERQEQTIEHARQVLEEKKMFWFSKRGRSKALDSVLERYIQDEAKQLDKREQRDQDDRNNRTKID